MLFGVQMLTTLIVGLFMSKFFSKYSWALLIFKNLTFYVPPTTEYLGQFSLAYKDHMKKKLRNGDKKQPLDEFNIPKDSDIQLKANNIESHYHISLMSHNEDIDIMILLTLASFVIYIVTECWIHFSPITGLDLHLSYIWSVVLLFYCAKFLCYMVQIYLQLKGGERSLCAVSTFFFLVMALSVSMAGEHIIDFGLDKGYGDVVDEMTTFANKTGFKHDLNIPSVKAFKGVLAVLSAVIGTLLTFPSIRLGNLNNRLLRSTTDSSFKQLLVHINMIAPLLLSFSWIKPLVKDHIQSQVEMSDEVFNMARLSLVAVVIIIRLFTLRLYTQSHLDLAPDFIRNLNKEAGKISYKTIQAKVSYTFQYGGIMVLQVLTPCIILLQLCVMLCSLQNTANFTPTATSSIQEMTQCFRAIFATSFLEGTMNYLVWWILSVSTFVSLLSTGYYHVTVTA